LINPKQRSSAIEPNQPVISGVVFRGHMQQELILADPEQQIPCPSFRKRLSVEKRVSSRIN
jgi:hypothetical protein